MATLGADMLRLAVLLLSFAIVTGVSAADTPSDPVFTAHSLRCEFGRGHMASWTRDAHQLVVKEETFSDPPGPLIFDNIDLTEGTARFVGTVGASDVTVSVSQTGLWLIERTPADNFNMITVFATNILAPEYPAVMSRHVIIGDEPMPSQYYGTCRVNAG
jgi:hypothetical protein